MLTRFLPASLSVCLALLCLDAITLAPLEAQPHVDSSENPLVVAQAGRDGSQAVEVVPLVGGLQHPWGMAWLPNEDLLITERPGRLRIVRDGELDPTPIAGIPELFVAGQGGLMDVSLHPRFTETRWIYLTYAYGDVRGNHTRVARARLDGMALQDIEVIFDVSQSKSGTQHFGSRMAWLPDETLLVSIGDGGNPPLTLEGGLIRQQAQALDSHLGKVIRLEDDGSIPPNNPFSTDPAAQPEIWSYGHRNIQGLTWDAESRRVWATEHGARGGDELNLLQLGDNFGWPVVTHSREYFGPRISAEESRPGMVDPRVVWTPSIAPSGLELYRGNQFPEWQGDLFAGGLVSRDIRHLELDDDGNVIQQRSIRIDQRVRDVREGPDGFLYVLTDHPEGQLLRLEPRT